MKARSEPAALSSIAFAEDLGSQFPLCAQPTRSFGRLPGVLLPEGLERSRAAPEYVTLGVPDVGHALRVDRVAPLSVYARSKRAGAMFCEAYRQFFGLRLTVVRYFNVYGPAQDWRRSIPPLMSAFAIKMLSGERPIIYGSGEKRRDFIYIDDVTEFNLLALNDPDGNVYNVGSGVNHSVNEIFREVEAVLETGLRPIYTDDLPGEAEITLAEISKERQLGWAPRVGLREGIERSIAYVRERVVGEGSRSRRG